MRNHRIIFREIPASHVTYTLGLVSILAGWVLAITYFAPSGLDIAEGSRPSTDMFSQVMIYLILILGTAIILATRADALFYGLLGLSGLGAVGMVAAEDAFQLWLWFEVMVIASYGLIDYRPTSLTAPTQPANFRVVLNYFVPSVVGSLFIALGIALIYLEANTLYLADISLKSDQLQLVIAALMLAGFGVKSAFVPMHLWLADVYNYAINVVSAWLAGIVTVMGIVGLMRILPVVAEVHVPIGELLILGGLVNMGLGNLLALNQYYLKRLLAYASLAHMGLMMIGLGIAYYSQTPRAITGVIWLIIAYGLLKVCLFLMVNILGPNPTRHALNGLGQTHPWLGGLMSCGIIGLAGMPPFVGFIGLVHILQAGLENANWLNGVMVLVVLNELVGLGYYLALLNHIWIHPATTTVVYKIEPALRLVLAGMMLGVFLLGVFPATIQLWLEEASYNLLPKGWLP